MSAPFLTLDLGNSCCKLRGWQTESGSPPQLLLWADIPADRELAGRAESWLGTAGEIAGAALCAVGPPELESALARLLEERFRAHFLAWPDPGLSIECREPERVGRDRLFAARAARELVRESCLVLDAGSALTVDALLVEADGRARFLGGAIAPGPALLARALASGTARLPEVQPFPNPRAVGRDTREALESGVALGFAGAARELVQRIGAEAGLVATPLVLTGGARAFLEQPRLFGERSLHVEPDLVHLGLLAAAGLLG